ncbi:NHS-like protein 2 [Trichomycterus rosablanca]|uniref:NHS-like protein 2 n=1 Tax=Trichomycterus rosablanca TaxID=2290929 RepID=UPI002F359207
MERTTLFAPSQTWKGPNVSTFSSEWDDSLNSYLLAPDVIKPPPQFQDPVEPCQSPPTSSSAIRRRDKATVRTGTKPKDRKSRPASAVEPHKRSLSLSTAVNSNPVGTRRRCESYALSYSSSSSDDSGSDSTSVKKGDHIPGAVPQRRARSIVLKKAKRKPSPPVRTVSLNRLADSKLPERRTQSLYIPNDGQSAMLLPDLIPSSQKKAGDSELTTISSEAPEKVPVNQPHFSHRSQKDLRFVDPCKSSTSSSGETPGNEATKVSSNSDCNNSPSSSRSSPSQRSISSPTKPPGSASPSSGYSSQCETPTQSTSITTGPSSLGCRMRQKPPSARNCRSRLSLQLPEMQASSSNPEPSTDLPKPNRRYSDASRPKQRLSNSILAMPMVTLEDLNNVRLRSVSSSELDSAAGMVSGVIEEENEQDASSVASQNSPKTKPPVAPKPAKRPTNALPATDFGTATATDPLVRNPNYKQESIYSTVNKIKSTIVLPARSDHEQGKEHIKETRRSQFQCGTGVVTNVQTFNTATDGNPCESHKTRKAQGPPVSKRPNMVYLCDNTRLKKSDKHIQSPHSSQQEYHVTVYGLIPTNVHAGDNKQTNASNIPDHEWYDKEEGQMPDIGALQLVNEEDEVFLQQPEPHTTEDLFTIIHRSKRRLFGRKDSFDNKQSDFGTQTLGDVSTTGSQNDNFMALLRRTRSAKASCGSRISATELLRSSKPAAPGAAELTSYKKHNMMQSHCP